MSNQQRPAQKDWDALSRRVEALETALRDRPQPQPDHIPDARKMVDTGWRNLHDLSPIYEPAPPEPGQPRAGLLDGLVNPDCAPDAVEQVLARVLRYMAEREAARQPAPPTAAQRAAQLLEDLQENGINESDGRTVLRVLAAWLEREASR